MQPVCCIAHVYLFLAVTCFCPFYRRLIWCNRLSYRKNQDTVFFTFHRQRDTLPWVKHVTFGIWWCVLRTSGHVMSRFSTGSTMYLWNASFKSRNKLLAWTVNHARCRISCFWYFSVQKRYRWDYLGKHALRQGCHIPASKLDTSCTFAKAHNLQTIIIQMSFPHTRFWYSHARPRKLFTGSVCGPNSSWCVFCVDVRCRATLQIFL